MLGTVFLAQRLCKGEEEEAERGRKSRVVISAFSGGNSCKAASIYDVHKFLGFFFLLHPLCPVSTNACLQIWGIS